MIEQSIVYVSRAGSYSVCCLHRSKPNLIRLVSQTSSYTIEANILLSLNYASEYAFEYAFEDAFQDARDERCI
ncbi:hypothetical protein BcDW1_5077 [Botrytis cinerea BcDW1]|uniref:Uncharacterized protein n=1 Tax=Botryotinia fuckeliana (strain BcDW1) TaxID=1290391 RepID=M7TRQ1_BOTF1|nr:hypothetical protein BcDW1_5077 [Botrytis cinerea BcDW1]